MIVSSEIGEDARCRAVLKTRISPMLLVSTTRPLPAHRPWSGGSTSLNSLAVWVALSTAFRPFTPVAPPADVLMLSQPGPRGTQLTDGTGNEVTWLSARLAAAERCRGWAFGDAIACGRDGVPALAPVAAGAAAVAVVLTGP